MANLMEEAEIYVDGDQASDSVTKFNNSAIALDDALKKALKTADDINSDSESNWIKSYATAFADLVKGPVSEAIAAIKTESDNLATAAETIQNVSNQNFNA